MTSQALLRRSLWVVLATALLVGVSVLLLTLSTVPTGAGGGKGVTPRRCVYAEHSIIEGRTPGDDGF